jgi:cell division septal protein FtsQ
MKTKSGKKVMTKRPVKRSAAARSTANGNAKRFFAKIVLPLVICICLVVCLGAMGYLSYQRVAASDFFGVRKVEVTGVERASKQNIETLVRTETERSGVLRADLLDLKTKVEKLPFVKLAAVTRVLPVGIRVQIVERVPQAIVVKGGKQVLVDADGETLALAENKEESLPFVMLGWDDAKTEKAWKENIERVKIYQKMLNEWRVANLASRVESVNLADLRDPKAVVADSGSTVSIAVGRENYGENLMNGIKAIVGKGDMFEGVNLVGSNMVLAPRKQN